MLAVLMGVVAICLALPIVSIHIQSTMKGMSKNMSRPNIATPGEAFSMVWHVEQIAHAALSMNVSTSAGSTDSAMSIFEVCFIIPRT